jgi:hypothetical protein
LKVKEGISYGNINEKPTKPDFYHKN